jgi:Mrp family chromosome partitioning ATPase
MENIREAVERAKRRNGPQNSTGLEPPSKQTRLVLGDSQESLNYPQEVELNLPYLQSHLAVAYDGRDVRSRPYDMLRTEILQAMDSKGWKTLAVVSPTPSCGKTLTAVNLALSLARQRQHQVLLIDLDLRRPQVATTLGLEQKDGVVGILERRLQLHDAVIRARAGDSRLEILPTGPARNPSDMIGSGEIQTLLEKASGQSPSRITIVDLPPLLAGHDAISILPLVDCVLMVAAVGTTKIKEISECNKYLEGSNVVRFVLNKASEAIATYVYY